MITDRTQADVDSVDLTSTTPNKGAYNYTDLNRVEAKVKELNELLINYGYMTYTLTTKLDWTMLSMYWQNTRYLDNIKKLVNNFYTLSTTPQVPANMNKLTYQKANDIEQILVDIENLIHGMKHYFVYSNVANSGQPRLWQNGFRHRLAKVWSGLTETTWSEFGTERWEDIMYEDNY